MKSAVYNTAETKARLNELIAEVEKGNRIFIRKRDKVVAMLTTATQPPLASSLEALRHFRALLKKKHGRRSHTLKILAEVRRKAR